MTPTGVTGFPVLAGCASAHVEGDHLSAGREDHQWRSARQTSPARQAFLVWTSFFFFDI